MTIEDKPFKRCTEWRGGHAAVTVNTVNYIDLLARYEDTGLTPDAISALRAQQEAEKNEPLTLEEMRKMDGEPVYVVPQNGGYVAGATNWAKVNAKCERCEAPNLNFYFCEYVTYWLAYRHPPKEAHNV